MLAVAALIAGIGTPVMAEAADCKMNVSSRTIYVGGSKVMSKSSTYSKGTYTLKLKNKAKRYSVSWSSSDESVATIEKLSYGKCKVTAVAPGTATITADYLDKVTKTMRSITAKITVKANCAAVDIVPASVSELEIGDTTQLKGVMYNAAGGEVTHGVDVTDTVCWESSNPNVATVSSTGLVTAKKDGTTIITCYTVQSTSGTYSYLRKATAKDTISVTVKKPPVPGLTGAAQKALNSFSVNLGSRLGELTKDNFTVTDQYGAAVAISSATLDSTGTIVTITTEKNLTNGKTYTVKLNGTTATTGLDTQFTTTDGIPAKMSLYTDISGAGVVAGAETEIKFKLYDANGVDITPADTKSTEYSTYKSKITFKTETTGSWFVTAANKLFVYTAGLSVPVIATYKDYRLVGSSYRNIEFTAGLVVQSVTVASTMSFTNKDVIITDSTKEGKLLDWENGKSMLSESDATGYKVVVRVKDYNGNYFYSCDDSRITFEQPSASAYGVYTDAHAYVTSGGSIIPLKQGEEVLTVKFEGTVIGQAVITIGAPRMASKMKLTVDGKETTNALMSDRYGVSTLRVGVQVFDQYGDEVTAAGGYPSLSGSITVKQVSATNYGPSGFVYNDADGSGYIEFDALGYGATSGNTFAYEITYGSGTLALTSYFTITVYTPNAMAASAYALELKGSTDVSITASTTELPKLDVVLYETKGGIRYDVISTVYPYNSSHYLTSGDYYYRVYSMSNNGEITKGTDVSQISLVYANSGSSTLGKYAPGAYKVVVFRKSGTSDVPVCNTTFTVTDKVNTPVVEQLSLTTNFPITTATSGDDTVLKAILAECFKITIGTDTIGTSQISFVTAPTVLDGAVYFRSIKVTETVVVDGQSCAIEHTIPINTLIRSK